MHRTAYIPAAYFLVEYQTETVTSFTILAGRGKRMELRFDGVFLGAKTKTLRQGQHANAVCIERIPGHMVGIVSEWFAFVGAIEG